MCQRDGRWSGAVAGPADRRPSVRRVRRPPHPHRGCESCWLAIGGGRCGDRQRCFRTHHPGHVHLRCYMEIALYVDDNTRRRMRRRRTFMGIRDGHRSGEPSRGSDAGWAVPQRRGAQHVQGLPSLATSGWPLRHQLPGGLGDASALPALGRQVKRATISPAPPPTSHAIPVFRPPRSTPAPRIACASIRARDEQPLMKARPIVFVFQLTHHCATPLLPCGVTSARLP